MKQIENLKEKSLLVIRQMLVKGIEATDGNIVTEWCILFSEDKPLLNDTELFEWVRNYMVNMDVKGCNMKLEKLRRQGEKTLRTKAKNIGYGAKLDESPKNKLATYSIFTKGKKYSGNYQKLCRRIGTLKKS